MYCTKCGKEISDSTKFCMYCGAPVGNGTSPQPETTTTSYNLGVSSEYQNKLRMFIEGSHRFTFQALVHIEGGAAGILTVDLALPHLGQCRFNVGRG